MQHLGHAGRATEAKVNTGDVAPVRPALDAVSVYPAPALPIESVENVAEPAPAATAVVPASAPPPGFAPMATATELVAPMMVLPLLSVTSTLSAAPPVPTSVAPAVPLSGATRHASALAGPATTPKVLEAMLPRPVALALSW